VRRRSAAHVRRFTESSSRSISSGRSAPSSCTSHETLRNIVLAQKKAVFGAGREHTVGLLRSFVTRSSRSTPM
jgi:hypothetical protein